MLKPTTPKGKGWRTEVGARLWGSQGLTVAASEPEPDARLSVAAVQGLFVGD